MKNLLIYTAPNKSFGNKEDETLSKIQIDNSLDLGWDRKDILLVTNFDYEYNGVKSIVIDSIYYDFDLPASKIPVVVYLIKNSLLEKDELYWCHDFDAYENFKIDEKELELSDVDLGLTHYFYKPEWQCGSFFFKVSSVDILELLDQTIKERPHLSRNNEKTLTWLIKHSRIDGSRYKRLNVTYNITKRYLHIVYPEADKPLKVLHFRPSNKDALMSDTALNMFMYGKNSLKMPLMNDRLIRVFNSHGIK